MSFVRRFQAEAYRAFRPPWPAEVQARILERAGGRRALAVDLGAGTGLVARWLAQSFERVVAVEPDERMLAELEPARGVEARRARAEEADFAPGSVDLVTIANAFHWMDGERVLARVHGWLRPGGVLAVLRHEPPPPAEGALGVLLRSEFDGTWAPFVHARLRDPDYSRRTLAASAFAASLEARWVPNPLSLARPEVLGYLRSTSFAGGHARSLPDPEGYWRALEERILALAGPGPFVLEFHAQLLLAARGEA